MSGYYTFYSTGFFGFGPPGTFKAYSLMHLMPILICVGLMVLVWFRRDRIREWKSEASLRLCISFLCFLMEFSFFVRLLYVGDSSGKYMMMAKVPLHVCDLGCICCMFMVTGKNRTLFGINFFVSLFGATIACAVPQMVLSDCGPAHFRYYQYFGMHLLPIFGTVYMMMGALLAAYMLLKRNAEKEGQTAQVPSLEQWLEEEIFASQSGKTTIEPTAEEVQGFETFTGRYRSALPAEKAAVDTMRW